MMQPHEILRATEVKHEEIKQPVWLMSFADFTGCMLASFVLLFALSQNEQARSQAAMGATAEAAARVATQDDETRGDETGGDETGTAETAMAAQPAEAGKDIDYLGTLLQTKLAADAALAEIGLLAEAGHIRLDLPPATLAPATDMEKQHAQSLLHALAGLLAVLPNDSIVQAELPLATGTAPDPWGAGLLAATGIVRQLRDAGAPETLIARTTPAQDNAAHLRILILRDSETQ